MGNRQESMVELEIKVTQEVNVIKIVHSQGANESKCPKMMYAWSCEYESTEGKQCRWILILNWVAAGSKVPSINCPAFNSFLSPHALFLKNSFSTH